MTNFFLETVFATAKGGPVTAYFKNGTSADYTTDILDMLKDDNTVAFITDGETGEIIYERG